MLRVPILCLTIVVLGALALKTKIEQAFEDAEILPETVPYSPQMILNVDYGKGKKVYLGTKLNAEDFTEKPKVQFVSDPFTMYTLVFIDMDSEYPTENCGRTLLLWLVVNIPGGAIERGEILYDYMDESTLVNYGNHRNLFLVFEQSDPQDFDEERVDRYTIGNRGDFILQQFLVKNEILINKVVCGNFFWVEYQKINVSSYEQSSSSEEESFEE